MKTRGGSGFLSGMLLGMLFSLIFGVLGLYLLIAMEFISVSVVEAPRIQALTEWTRYNLGLSILPFAVTIGLYLHNLQALSRGLRDNLPQDEIAQLEQLTDIWISLFFGIGVIWTAIGMRSALLHALGEPDFTGVSGAYVVLQRLVEGGILTALTTTIAGGIGGYLMRVFKSAWLGTRLSRYYQHQDRIQAARVEGLLSDIRTSINDLSVQSIPASCEWLEER